MANSRRKEQTARPSPDTTEKGRLLEFVGAPYKSISDKHQFLEDSFYGDGGYENGQYLIPHPRETLSKFERRQALAYYFNYVLPCVKGNVMPIFKEAPIRSYGDSKEIKLFIEHSNRRGQSLNRFMKDAALKAKLHGFVIIVVDNFSAEELQGKNLHDILSERLIPYVYTVTAKKIHDYALDIDGRLEMLALKREYTKVDDNGNKQSCLEITTWTTNRVSRKINGQLAYEVDNPIKRVPAVVLYGAEPKEQRLETTSEFWQIAKTNHALYNACSELREMNRNQAFNILTYPIGEEDDWEQARSVIVGTDNVLLYRTGSQSPAYISPAGTPADMLMNEINMFIQEIYRMANLAGVTGVKQQTSGIAKEWDYETTNMSLSDFAKNIEQAEKDIFEIFKEYAGLSQIDIEIKYNDEFGITDVTEKLDEVSQSLALQVGGRFDIECKKIAARVMFKNQLDVTQEVVEDIEKIAEDKLYEDINGDDEGDS